MDDDSARLVSRRALIWTLAFVLGVLAAGAVWAESSPVFAIGMGVGMVLSCAAALDALLPKF